MLVFNNKTLLALMATSSGGAAVYAHELILDFQRNEVLRRLGVNEPDLFAQALDAIKGLNALAKLEGFDPVIDTDLDTTSREEVEKAIFSYVLHTLDVDSHGAAKK